MNLLVIMKLWRIMNLSMMYADLSMIIMDQTKLTN